MAARGRRPPSSRSSGGHRYPRSARVSETLREIIADELVRIDDERLHLVTVTQIEVDNELNRAIVFYDSLAGPDGDGDIIDALGQHRVRLQSSIARQIRAKKTPILIFRPDDVIRSAERIEEVLRRSRELGGGPDAQPDSGSSPDVDATSDPMSDPTSDPTSDPMSDPMSDPGPDAT